MDSSWSTEYFSFLEYKNASTFGYKQRESRPQQTTDMVSMINDWSTQPAHCVNVVQVSVREEPRHVVSIHEIRNSAGLVEPSSVRPRVATPDVSIF
jgi:hypothetical protein